MCRPQKSNVVLKWGTFALAVHGGYVDIICNSVEVVCSLYHSIDERCEPCCVVMHFSIVCY